MRIVVDLPAPFGPRKPVTMPGRTVNESSSTASVSPYRLVREVTSIMPPTLTIRPPGRIVRAQARGLLRSQYVGAQVAQP
jgi:hypothetical protein